MHLQEFQFVRIIFLHQLVEKPTRFRHVQNSTLLDLIITNHDALISEVSESTPPAKVTMPFFTLSYVATKTSHRKSSLRGSRIIKVTIRQFKMIFSKIHWEDELDRTRWTFELFDKKASIIFGKASTPFWNMFL